MAEHRVMLVLNGQGSIAGPLASAEDVVIADVQEMEIVRWQMHHVGWGAPGNGAVAARITAFVAQQAVQAIVVGHVSSALREALAEAGVAVFQRSGISARAAAVSAGTVLSLIEDGP